MTDDSSPENLRKFLESDDPALVRMGLSMAKGSGVPEELYKNVFGLSLWDLERENREIAEEMVKKIDLENIPEFQLPDYIDSKFIERLLIKDERIFESAIQALKNIGERTVGILIEILYFIPVDSNSLEIEAITNALGELEDTRAVEPLIRIVDNCDKIELYDDSDGWVPITWQSDYVFWAIEALERIGDTRALGSLVNALSWGPEEVSEDYTDLFSERASKALAKMLLKFDDGIPDEHLDAAIACADTLIWLIREEESAPLFPIPVDKDWVEELYDLLEPLSKLAEIGWDAETGLGGWDPEFFYGELNGDEFDLKAFLSNRKK